MYPLVTGISKMFGAKNKVLKNAAEVKPASSIFDIEIKSNNGKEFSLKDYQGKYILIANTASNCGFTGQYDELQKLYSSHQDKLVVIGFPANDFQEQEKGSDAEISEFCKINYGVTFPLASKSVVVKNQEQHPLFKWLTDKSKNGWNDQAPEWNFSKYLVAPDGKLLGYYGTAVSPLDIKIP
ncbi:MAG: glutathione peroxidase [Flavitalea sp.]